MHWVQNKANLARKRRVDVEISSWYVNINPTVSSPDSEDRHSYDKSSSRLRWVNGRFAGNPHKTSLYWTGSTCSSQSIYNIYFLTRLSQHVTLFLEIQRGEITNGRHNTTKYNNIKILLCNFCGEIIIRNLPTRHSWWETYESMLKILSHDFATSIKPFWTNCSYRVTLKYGITRLTEHIW